MTRSVTGPDGRPYSFPDDATDDEVLRFFNEQDQRSATTRDAAVSLARHSATQTNRRSLWERLSDNASDTWNTGWLAEGFRAGRLEGAQGVAKEKTFEEIQGRDGFLTNPAQDFGRVVGSVSQVISSGTLADAKADVAGERQRREDLAATNDRQRGGDSFLSYFREGDVLGGVAHGSAALLGVLAGAATDPLSYVTGGETLLAKALTQGAVAAGGDFLAQDSSIAAGVQDRYDLGRTALSAAAGSTFTVAGELATATPKAIAARFFHQPEADVRADLDVADDLLRPAMSEQDVPALPAPAAVTSGLPEGAVVLQRVEGGGALPGDVWNPELNAWMHRVDGPTAEATGKPAAESAGGPEARAASQDSGTAEGTPGGTQETPEGNGAEGYAGGDGRTGWSDVDWGKRLSPARAQAAMAHLDALTKAIKPEHVEAFIRRLDAGPEDANQSAFINKDWVNWEAFKNKPEEVLGLSNLFADVFDDLYKQAGSNVQSWDVLKAVTRQYGHTLSDVLKTHADVTGEGGLARKMMAMSDVFHASVDDAQTRIRAIRDAARSGQQPTAAQIRELAELAQRTAILGANEAAVSSEVARALNSRKSRDTPIAMVNDLQAAFNELDGVMQADGKLSDAATLDKVLSDLLDGFDKKGAVGFNSRFRKMRQMGVMDYVGYAVVANLLSGIPTHFKNLVGTPTHSMLDLSARFVAATTVAPIRRALLGSAARDTRSVQVRESVAYVEGLYDALGDSLRLAFQAFKKGAPVADNVSGVIQEPHQVPFAFSRERLDKWRRQGFTPATAGDIAGVAYFELARTLGFRPSVAADEFNKGLARHAQVNALALREAAYQSAKYAPGRERDQVFNSVANAIRQEPTAEAIAAAKAMFGFGGQKRDGVYGFDSPEFEMQNVLRSIDARQAAMEHAQLLAYQKTGATLESLEKFLRRVPLVKHFAANFIRTPAQLFQASFRDYNPVTAPIVLLAEMASPVGRARHKAFWDALRGDEDAMEGGAAAAEMVIARQVVGAGVLGVIYGYWSNGDIVGADVPQGDEYAGVLPYSIRVPGLGWVQFTGYSPLAEHLGLVADLGQIMRTKELTDDQEFSLMGSLAVAVRGNVFNKSFLKGLADLMDVMEGGAFPSDDSAATERGMVEATGSLFWGRAIPASSFLKRMAQEGDPVVRDARGFLEEATAYLPGLSETLAAKRDFLGRVVIRKSGERGMVQVAKTSAPTTDALDRELANLANDPRVNLRITPTPTVIDGQRLTAEEHNRLQEIQGQLVRSRRTGWNMEETLRDLITTQEYRDADPRYRETLIKRIITDFRADGKKAAFDPEGQFFMRSFAERTGQTRLLNTARSRGWSADEAMRRRGRSYGLSSDDTEMLREALDEMEAE